MKKILIELDENQCDFIKQKAKENKRSFKSQIEYTLIQSIGNIPAPTQIAASAPKQPELDPYDPANWGKNDKI